MLGLEVALPNFFLKQVFLNFFYFALAKYCISVDFRWDCRCIILFNLSTTYEPCIGVIN